MMRQVVPKGTSANVDIDVDVGYMPIPPENSCSAQYMSARGSGACPFQKKKARFLFQKILKENRAWGSFAYEIKVFKKFALVHSFAVVFATMSCAFCAFFVSWLSFCIKAGSPELSELPRLPLLTIWQV